MGLISFIRNKFKNKTASTDKYSKSLEKSRKNFSSRLTNLSQRYKTVNEEYFEELEQILIESDVGVNLAIEIIDDVLKKSKEENLTNPSEINEILVDRMFDGYLSKGNIVNEIKFNANEPTVLLVVGVNGVGKTTTIAKIANMYKKKGKKVLLVAGDTFRAGAVEQLSVWSERLNVPLVKGEINSDPASVCYDGVKKGKNEHFDLVIVDTAGRLQNKTNLMAELAKIKRVIGKEIINAPQETFLIIDATTGQNGVLQAKAFAEVTNLTGVVITKMDGTSKGGIILSIREEIGVPVRFIGLGEKMEDLEEFDLEKYLYGLCVEDGTN